MGQDYKTFSDAGTFGGLFDRYAERISKAKYAAVEKFLVDHNADPSVHTLCYTDDTPAEGELFAVVYTIVPTEVVRSGTVPPDNAWPKMRFSVKATLPLGS